MRIVMQWLKNISVKEKLCVSFTSLFWKRYIKLGSVRYPYKVLITYLPTPRNSVVLEKLTGFQLVKKFPAFYVTRRFVTAFTTTRHLSLSWASSIQVHIPTSYFLKIHLNIILPSMPGSPKWSLSQMLSRQNPVYASPLPYTRYMSRPSHSSRFYHPNIIGWGVQIIQLLIMQLPPLPCYLVSPRPKFLLSTNASCTKPEYLLLSYGYI